MRSFTLGSAIVLLTLGASFLVAPGCQAVTNTTAVQCTSEAECLSLGPEFAGTTCDPATKTCVKSPENVGSCTKNQECIDAAGGGAAICRRSDRRCVNLVTPECPNVFTRPGNADLANDNVIVIGAIEPGPNIELGIVFERAVELAAYEIQNSEFRGLPPVPGSSDARPFAVLACREFGQGKEGLERGARHLAEDVQVPVVVGPVDPSNVAPLASNIFMPNKILTIAPIAITTSVAALPGNPIAPTPLVWRTFFSDAAIAKVSAEFITNQWEPLLKSKSPDPIKVALIGSGDLLGQSEVAEFLKVLRFNGKDAGQNQADGNLLVLNIGDFDDPVANPNPDAKIGQAIGAVFQQKPQIVIHSYTPTAISKVYFPIEGGWPEGSPRPYHLGATPVFNGFGPIFPFLSQVPFRNGRLVSVQNYTNPAGTSSPFPVASPQVQSWLSRFNDRNQEFVQSVSPKSQNTWSNYDSTYLAAYAIVALRDKPVTGDNLAQVLGRFNAPGVVVNTYDGPTGDMSKAFAELLAGRNIDLNGLFGNMNFDVASAAPNYGLEITCPIVDGSGRTTGMQGSGFHFKPEAGVSVITSADGVTDNPATGALVACPPPPP